MSSHLSRMKMASLRSDGYSIKSVEITNDPVDDYLTNKDKVYKRSSHASNRVHRHWVQQAIDNKNQKFAENDSIYSPEFPQRPIDLHTPRSSQSDRAPPNGGDSGTNHSNNKFPYQMSSSQKYSLLGRSRGYSLDEALTGGAGSGGAAAGRGSTHQLIGVPRKELYHSQSLHASRTKDSRINPKSFMNHQALADNQYKSTKFLAGGRDCTLAIPFYLAVAFFVVFVVMLLAGVTIIFLNYLYMNIWFSQDHGEALGPCLLALSFAFLALAIKFLIDYQRVKAARASQIKFRGIYMQQAQPYENKRDAWTAHQGQLQIDRAAVWNELALRESNAAAGTARGRTGWGVGGREATPAVVSGGVWPTRASSESNLMLKSGTESSKALSRKPIPLHDKHHHHQEDQHGTHNYNQQQNADSNGAVKYYTRSQNSLIR